MSDVIINIDELEKNENPKNSDYILSMIEVCTYPLKYHLSKANTNTTKKFWDDVMEHEKFKTIFKVFKSETLRKYWRCIREAKDNNTFIKLVKANLKIIDNPVFKLLPVINGITNFIKNKENDFEEFFKNLHNKNKKLENKKVEKNDEKKNVKNNNNKKIDNMLNQKRNEPSNDNKEDKNEKKSEKKNEQKKEEKNEDELQIEEKETIEENYEIKNCDEMINSLQKFFPESNRKELFNILYQTSGNIKYAYLYLSDPEKNDKYCFVQTDDYIIQNLRDKSYYQTLIEQKGIDLIRERENFLNLKNN